MISIVLSCETLKSYVWDDCEFVKGKIIFVYYYSRWKKVNKLLLIMLRLFFINVLVFLWLCECLNNSTNKSIFFIEYCYSKDNSKIIAILVLI